MKEVSRELLASRQDVWAFLSEPYHLADWWPRIRGVEPDRRGFAPGARWQVYAMERMPLMGWREPKRPSMLLIRDIYPLERWTWHLTGDTAMDVEVRLKAVGPDRTLVTIGVGGSWKTGRVKVAQVALNRLYDLVQTAATL